MDGAWGTIPAVCVLAAAWLWVRRSVGRSASPAAQGRWRWRAPWQGRPGSLECETALRLTPNHSVHAIACGGRRWLVCCHGNGMTVVAEVGVPLGGTREEPLRAEAARWQGH